MVPKSYYSRLAVNIRKGTSRHDRPKVVVVGSLEKHVHIHSPMRR